MCERCFPDSRVSATRRSVLAGMAGLAAAVTVPRVAMADSATAPQNAISPDDALARLMAGNERYATGNGHPHDYNAERAARTKGQWPIAGILSCADSRVSPELLFDQAPGDLFVVRVAGNVVNVDGLGSFEYGAKFLGTPLIVVLGHTRCGAVDAAIKTVRNDAALPGHLPDLIDAIEPAVVAAKKEDPSDLLLAATAENVRLGKEALVSQSTILGDAVAAGKLKVVGGIYELATGRIKMI